MLSKARLILFKEEKDAYKSFQFNLTLHVLKARLLSIPFSAWFQSFGMSSVILFLLF